MNGVWGQEYGGRSNHCVKQSVCYSVQYASALSVISVRSKVYVRVRVCMRAQGEVEVKKLGADGAVLHTSRLSAGSYFGELALRHAGDKRQATVTAVGAVVCLYMDRKNFVELMGPLEDMLSKKEGMRQ